MPDISRHMPPGRTAEQVLAIEVARLRRDLADLRSTILARGSGGGAAFEQGTFTGNGATGRQIATTGIPKFVMVQGTTNATCWWRVHPSATVQRYLHSTTTNGSYTDATPGTDNPIYFDGVNTGFYVSAVSAVGANESGSTYYWIALVD